MLRSLAAWVRPVEAGGMVALGLFSLHQVWLISLWWRTRRRTPQTTARFATLPLVTVQLPLFNEPYVAERLLDAVSRLEYPKDRLELQVLDDSTDDTPHLLAGAIDALRARGWRVAHLRRTQRDGFKAGALQAGLAQARGEFIAIFDADFVPPADFLARTIHHFTDARLGMLQARWGHLNRDDSWLTRAEALMVDGHFLIDQSARSRGGYLFNFNGSAGVWRKRTIVDAGGWQSDTLCEDLDLSYRAQLKGWQFRYLPDVVVPAELPIDMASLKLQQHRWTKGSMQTARKLLPAIWRSAQPLQRKLEATFHLGNWLSYPFGLLATVLVLPTLILLRHPLLGGAPASAWEGWMGLLLIGTTLVFYGIVHAEQRLGGWRLIMELPVLMTISAGLALTNTLAIVEAFRGGSFTFHRTPKYNGRRAAAGGMRAPALPSGELWRWELGLGLYTSAAVWYALHHRYYSVAPFLVVLAVGFLYACGASVWPSLREAFDSGRAWRQPGRAYELGS